MSRDCPATREAIEEMEERGEVGCPICGRPSQMHPDPDGDWANVVQAASGGPDFTPKEWPEKRR